MDSCCPFTVDSARPRRFSAASAGQIIRDALQNACEGLIHCLRTLAEGAVWHLCCEMLVVRRGAQCGESTGEVRIGRSSNLEAEVRALSVRVDVRVGARLDYRGWAGGRAWASRGAARNASPMPLGSAIMRCFTLNLQRQRETRTAGHRSVVNRVWGRSRRAGRNETTLGSW